jgi:hypothetical protein
MVEQDTVYDSLSSTEVEYRGDITTREDVVWIWTFLEELGLYQGTIDFTKM